MPDRLAKLEVKLGGGGAFGGSHPPSIASTDGSSGYQPDTAMPGVSVAAPKAVSKKNPSLSRETDRRNDKSAPEAGEPGVNTPEAQSIVNRIPYEKKFGDYMPAIRRFPGDAVARWTSFPVRIKLPEGSPDSWQRILEDGVKKWGQYIPLKIVQPGEVADIDVTWVNHLVVPRILGITRLQTPEGVLQMQVFLVRPTFYLPQIPEHALAGAFLHELGHGLGILGHSDKPGDVMFQPDTSGRPVAGKPKAASIEPRDVNTLRRIYDTQAVPAGFSLPQPLEWNFR